MVVDIIEIPISTVISKATFSVGGRVMNPYCASLSLTTIKSQVWGGDLICHKYGLMTTKTKPRALGMDMQDRMTKLGRDCGSSRNNSEGDDGSHH